MEYKKTRSDLLKLGRARALVLYGETILKKKTILLTTTLLITLMNYKKDLESDKALVRAAINQIDFTLSLDGVQSTLSASNLITTTYALDFRVENIIGTAIPFFLMKDLVIKREYGKLATSLRIVESSYKFGKLLEELVEDANTYIRIKKLVQEVSRTRVRYNSLDKKLLPSLNSQRKSIVEFLSSLEREENFNIRSLVVENII